MSAVPQSDEENMPPQQQSNPVLQYYREWSERTPYVTRTLMIILVASYIISFFFQSAVVLGNVPYFSVFSFEVYRLILSPFVGNSIFDIILVALFFPAMGGRMESMWGSSSYLAIILILTIVTNISFIVVCVLLYMFGLAQALFFECTGFWVVLFSLLTIESMQAPDMPRRMMFIPMDIPSKYFPLIMYGLFCLFSGPILSYAVALGVGYVYSQGYMERLRPTSYYLEGLESPGGMLHTVSRSRGWILAGAAIGHDAWIALNSTPAGGQGASWAQQGQQQGQGQGQQSRGFGGFGGLGSDQGHGSGSGSGGGQEKPSAFAGSGHKLGAASSTQASGGMGSWLGGASSSAASASAATMDRETIAARRLAAINAQAQNTSGSQDSGV